MKTWHKVFFVGAGVWTSAALGIGIGVYLHDYYTLGPLPGVGIADYNWPAMAILWLAVEVTWATLCAGIGWSLEGRTKHQQT